MTTLKTWLGNRLSTPEKARSTMSVFVSIGGTFGFAIAALAAYFSHF